MSFLSVTGGYAARAVLLLALVFSANAAHAARFLYTGGPHALSSARVTALGHTFATFPANDAGWASAFSGGYGAFDAVLVGEGLPAISPATQTSIASYVSSGGRVIVASDHNGNVNFINQVFGYATTLNYGCRFDGSVAGSKQTTFLGSTFAAGPPTVGNLSCTSALNLASVPVAARTVYAGAGTSVVFAGKYGSGNVVWLGYDFFSIGATAAQIDDWYLLLDNSIRFTGFFSNCSAEGFTGSRLTLCRQVCEIPQTSLKLASLVKLYTTAYRTAIPCTGVVGYD